MAGPSSSTAAPGTIKAPAERQLKTPRKPAADHVAEQRTAPTEQAFPPASNKRSAAATARSTNPFDAVDRATAAAVEAEPTMVRLPEAPAEAMPPRAVARAAKQMVEEGAAVETTVMATAVGDEARAQSDRLLVAARKALAVGDAARAMGLVGQAKAVGARYDLHEDNPAKIEAAIQRQAELVQLRIPKDSETFRRRQVDLLLSQAESLLLWKEFDDAERLANDAAHLPVTYGPFDSKPQDLLNRVAAGRRRSGRFRDNAVAPAEFETPAASDTAPAAPAGQMATDSVDNPAAPTSRVQPPPAAHAPPAPTQGAQSSSRKPIRRGMCRRQGRS